MKFLTIVAAVSVLSSAHAGGVYKCVVDGHTIFSQVSCGDEAEQVKTWALPVSPSGDSGASSIENNPLLLEYRAKNKAMVDAQSASALNPSYPKPRPTPSPRTDP
jgi:hypothetical protein